MGAAYLAGLAIGYWSDIEDIKNQWKLGQLFEPASANASELLKGWQRAIHAAKAWTEF
jgi:glycerol kinase